MGARITLNKTGITLDRCLRFVFRQDRYRCFGTFDGSFLVGKEDIGEIFSIEAAINGKTVLRGFVDQSALTQSSEGRILTVKARSTAALLGDNYLKPGMYPTVSLDKLVTQLIRIDGITCQSSPTPLNYIYVKDNASMWDMITVLCLRQYGRYPYVAQGNVVRYTTGGGYQVVRPSRILSMTSRCDNTKLISDLHMQDSEGNYDVYQTHSDYPLQRGILRHKQIGLDMCWLADINEGLAYHLGYAQRGAKAYDVIYPGYTGEDLYDRIAVDTATAVDGASTVESMGVPAALAMGKICALTVRGDETGIVTAATVYEDMYSGLTE